MVVVLGGASAYRRCRAFGGKVPWIPSALYTSVTMENASLPVVTTFSYWGPVAATGLHGTEKSR